MKAKMMKTRGDMTAINLSRRLNISCLPELFEVSSFEFSKYLSWVRMQANSMRGTMLKVRQLIIQIISALAFPPDLGESLTTVFKVLIKQRKRVSNNASLPGTASFGTK